MPSKQILDLIVAVAGAAILIWLLLLGITDLLARDRAKRKPAHNLLLIVLSLVFLIRIVLKDLLPLL